MDKAGKNIKEKGFENRIFKYPCRCIVNHRIGDSSVINNAKKHHNGAQGIQRVNTLILVGVMGSIN